MPAVNRVLRSVFITPEMDHFLSVRAFTLHMDKSDLIKEYLVRGARLQLEEAMAADPRSPEGRPASTNLVRLARVANILPSLPAPKNTKPQSKTVKKAPSKPTKVAKTTTAKKVVKTTGSRTVKKATSHRRAPAKKR